VLTRLVSKLRELTQDPAAKVAFTIGATAGGLKWLLTHFNEELLNQATAIGGLTDELLDRYPGDRALALETLLERKGVLRAEEIDELLYESLLEEAPTPVDVVDLDALRHRFEAAAGEERDSGSTLHVPETTEGEPQ